MQDEFVPVDAREAAYQEVARRMTLLQDPTNPRLRYYFSAVCLRVREVMPVFSSSEIETLWQRWLAEEGENRSNR